MKLLVSTIPRVVGTEMGEQVYDPVVAGGRESELGSIECLVKVCCGTVRERGLLCCCQLNRFQRQLTLGVKKEYQVLNVS